MHNYFVYDKEIIPIIGAQSYSTGDGLELSTRYGYDYSKAPQTLTHRKRNTALTATVQAVVTPSLCAENDVFMMDYVSRIENLSGKKVDFYWNGENIGSFVIQSVQFSCSADAVNVFSQISVSLSMTEGYVRRETLSSDVRTL